MKLLQGIHSSIETQNFDKSMNEDMVRNPDSYNDNARTILSSALQIPTSQRLKLGYNSVEPYLYPGGNYDWQKSIKDAQGTPQTIFGQQTLSKDNLNYVTPTFKALSNPAQFMQSLMGDLAKKKAGKSASYEYSQLSPDQVNAVNQAYNAIPQTEFDKWGIQKPNLDVPDQSNSAAQYVSYLSKLHAINNLPTPSETKTIPNEAAKQAFELKKLGIEHTNRLSEKGADNTLVNDAYDEINKRGTNIAVGNGIPFNELSNTTQAALTKDLIGNDKQLGVDKLAIIKGDNGNWRLSKVQTEDNGKVTITRDLYHITPKGINLVANTNQKQRQVVLSKGNEVPKQEGYTNITETQKGTIGRKNGKWYDVKTGKLIE
jgi:hypothetical protein